MTVREIVKLLRDDGWYESETKGSHVQYDHPTKKGTVTVTTHSGVIAKGTTKPNTIVS